MPRPPAADAVPVVSGSRRCPQGAVRSIAEPGP